MTEACRGLAIHVPRNPSDSVTPSERGGLPHERPGGRPLAIRMPVDSRGLHFDPEASPRSCSGEAVLQIPVLGRPPPLRPASAAGQGRGLLRRAERDVLDLPPAAPRASSGKAGAPAACARRRGSRGGGPGSRVGSEALRGHPLGTTCRAPSCEPGRRLACRPGPGHRRDHQRGQAGVSAVRPGRSGGGRRSSRWPAPRMDPAPIRGIHQLVVEVRGEAVPAVPAVGVTSPGPRASRLQGAGSSERWRSARRWGAAVAVTSGCCRCRRKNQLFRVMVRRGRLRGVPRGLEVRPLWRRPSARSKVICSAIRGRAAHRIRLRRACRSGQTQPQ